MGRKLGLVLAGGGARGAFEVGALAWLAEHRPDLLEQVKVVTGTSVGAVNAAFLVSRGLTPHAVEELEALWLGLRLDGVIRMTRRRLASIAFKLGRPLLGSREQPALGLFDTGPYEKLITESVDWDQLHRNISNGRFDALALAATEISSGCTHVFVEQRDPAALPRWADDPWTVGVSARLGPAHVLASTSLPILFSPVKVGQHWYSDGGLRHNVPLSPALRLGADALIAVSLGRSRPPDLPVPDVFPGMLQLIGKLLNSIFLTRMRWDLDRLNRLNAVLEGGSVLYGPEFIPRLQDEMRRRGRRPYQVVKYVGIRPHVDIGVVANDVLKNHKAVSHLGRLISRFLRGDGRQADLASYLLFDGGFARELIRIGRESAASVADELDGLLK
ncbi:MAG: NTE family protein [Myxococcota bacterium]|jgi:NTE family protein